MWYLDWQRIGSIGYLLLVLITVEMRTTAQRSQHGQTKGVRATYLKMLCLFVSLFFLFISRVSQVYAKRLLVSEEWPCNRNSPPPSLVNRELKQQRRGRLRKRQLKCVFALLKTLSRLFHFVLFIRCWRIFLELNSKGLYLSSGKEKEGRCLVFTSSTKKVKLGSLTS